MKRLRGNLLVQFSVFSFVIMVILGVSLVITLNRMLGNDISLLVEHGNAMMSGIMIKDSDPFSIPNLTDDVRTIQFVTIGMVSGSFLVLYLGLFSLVSRGYKTIKRQRATLDSINSELERRVSERTAELESIQKSMADGLLVIGSDHHVRYFN